MKLHISSYAIVIITVYISPTGNITYFLNNLEAALNQIYSNTPNIILCGDFNINYLNDNQNKQALNSLLRSYNLCSLIDFPKRIHNNSNTPTIFLLTNLQTKTIPYITLVLLRITLVLLHCFM